MKTTFHVLFALILVFAPATALAQKKSDKPAVKVGQPQFFALSVANLDESVRWYVDTLGAAVVKTLNAPDGSARVAILEADGLRIELLQHGQSFHVKKHVPDLKGEFLVQGIFKVGFFVDDLDGLARRWKDAKVAFLTDVIEEKDLNQKFVLVRDNSGNILQAFQRLR
jgi:catechol 2,3-dioxygenase-like lactoylglutathione lyase family enzyme